MGPDVLKTQLSSLFGRGLRYNTSVPPAPSGPLVDLFVHARRESNYPRILGILKKLRDTPFAELFDMALYIRSPRGGAGERQVGRYIFQWLLINFPDETLAGVKEIPEWGRWDDLLWLFPEILKLESVDFVSRNYISDVNLEKLARCRRAQSEVVDFVCEELLRSYKTFCKGGSPGLLCKWLPSEQSAFNRKYKIAERICSTLEISLQDYRVIYISPMRKALRVTEVFMCARKWDELRGSELPAGCRRKNRGSLRRHGVLSQKNLATVCAPPDETIEHYITMLLQTSEKSTRVRPDEYREAAWNAACHSLASCQRKNTVCVVSSEGTMYGVHGRSRIVSKAFAAAIFLASVAHAPFTNKVFMNSSLNRLKELDTSRGTLLEKISRLRMTFTEKAKICDLRKSLKEKTPNSEQPDVVLYMTSTGYDMEEVQKASEASEAGGPHLVVWNMCALNFNFLQRKGVTYVEGYRDDVLRYLLVCGDYDPRISVASPWRPEKRVLTAN